jgi:Tfp pilus assembly protein PilP
MSPLGNRLLSALLFFSIVSTPFGAYAGEKQGAAAAPAQDMDHFSYTSQDRRDPFEPVYLQKAAKRTSAGTTQKEGYELDELKFVGVMKSGAVTFALMEDMQGKGLLFKKGDFINKNLWVLDTLEDKVILAYKLRGDIRKISLDIPRK